MRRDVLLARRIVRGKPCTMTLITHQSVSMTAGQLLFARVAVINQNHEPGSPVKESCDSPHPVQCRTGNFASFANFWVKTVAVEIPQFFCRCGSKVLDECSIVLSHANRAAIIDDLNRHCVKELIGKDDEV